MVGRGNAHHAIVGCGVVVGGNAVVACCGNHDGTGVNCFLASLLHVCGGVLRAQAQVDDVCAGLHGLVDALDHRARSAAARRAKDPHRVKVDLGRYAGDAYAVVVLGGNEAGDEGAVT